MPNWCYSKMIVSKKVADMIVSTIKGEDGKDKEIVDFNKLVPMPEAVRHTTSGSYNRNNVYYFISGRFKKTPAEVWNSKRGRLLFSGDEALYSVSNLENLAELANETKEYVEKQKGQKRYIVGKDGKPLTDCEGHKIRTYSVSYAEGRQHVQNYEKYGAATWYEWACLNWGTKWNASDAKVTHLKDGKVEISFSTAWCPPNNILCILSQTEPIFIEYEIECNGYGSRTYDHGKVSDGPFRPYWYDEDEEEKKVKKAKKTTKKASKKADKKTVKTAKKTKKDAALPF